MSPYLTAAPRVTAAAGRGGGVGHWWAFMIAAVSPGAIPREGGGAAAGVVVHVVW